MKVEVHTSNFDYDYCCSDRILHRDVYGTFVSSEAHKAYAPFCLLKRNIAEFYQLELEYSKRKGSDVLTFGGSLVPPKKNFWHDSYEEYYLRRVTQTALTLLRFTVAAAVGEVRHFKSVVKDPEDFEDEYESGCDCDACTSARRDVDKMREGKEEAIQKYERAKQYVMLAVGNLGYKSIPNERQVVYRAYVAEKDWLRCLAATRYAFKETIWDSAYGGEKWGIGCEHAIRLYRTLCGGTFSDIAIWFDTLINHFHNGGLLLNKFDCTGSCMGLQTLLNDKSAGYFSTIYRMQRETPCNHWGSTCEYVLRIKPGGNNGS